MFLTAFTCAFASDISPAEEIQKETKPNSSHFYVGGVFSADAPVFRFGVETKYIDMPLFQRFSLDGLASLEPKNGVAARISGLHYWSAPEKDFKWFSRVALFGYEYSPNYKRNGVTPLLKDALFGLPMITLGLEIDHANHSMTRVEANLNCVSATYVF